MISPLTSNKTVFRDDRGKEIAVGDAVVVLEALKFKTDWSDNLIVYAPGLKVDKIKSLEYQPGTGFAEMGDVIKMVTETDIEIVGDAENGWGGSFYALK